MSNEAVLVNEARSGSRAAFDSLAAPHVPALRAFALRMVMQPEDAEDLVQDALVTAHAKVDAFRGEATFRTWLFSIVTRRCLDVLRERRRWPVLGQTQASDQHLESPALMDELAHAASDPSFVYDSREHIAYCFSCIGRTLPPEETAALLLREVFDLTNDEAAKAVGVSTSVLRHHLAHARQTMTETFDGLCALVGKRGACWQCSGLRDALPEDKRGPPVQPLCSPDENPEERLRKRLTLVREARFGREPLDSSGAGGNRLHGYIVRFMARSFD